jgi:hypothetical protein
VWTTSGFPVYSTWPSTGGVSVGVSYFPNNRWGRRAWRRGWRGW